MLRLAEPARVRGVNRRVVMWRIRERRRVEDFGGVRVERGCLVSMGQAAHVLDDGSHDPPRRLQNEWLPRAARLMPDPVGAGEQA